MAEHTIINGNSLLVLPTLAADSFDSCVCDPPYELTTARPGGRSLATKGKVMGGFMGMKWDGTGIAFCVDLWREVFRVMKPGAHLLAFGGSRTYHRMAGRRTMGHFTETPNSGNSPKARNHHPTVKPTDLMQYLCRLVTPAGGLILDPFLGSGSTAKAALIERFNVVGIELNPEYVEIAKARLTQLQVKLF